MDNELFATIASMVQTHGLMGLFAGCFLAASLLPIASEVFLQTYFLLGDQWVSALLIATAGNCAGIALNYGIGRWIGNLTVNLKSRLMESINGVRKYMDKHGRWALVLTVFPFIGDPLTLASGYYRIPFWLFGGVAFSLRFLRYYLLFLGQDFIFN